MAVGDDDGPVGERIEPMRGSEGGEPRGAAVAGVALAADSPERVDPSVGRHNPDAVVVLRDVEVPGGVEGEVAVAAELRRGCRPAVAREPRVPLPATGVFAPSGSNRQIRPSSAT